MTRTFRLILMSTGLGAAVLALPWPAGGDAQAQDSAVCMQDVATLRAMTSAGRGGDATIEASANAAEEACMAGDDGLASAYIADAERRLNLREAQRDESGATADAGDGAGGVAAGGSLGAGVSAAALSRDADDDDSFGEEAGDEIADTAGDVGNEIEDAAEDVGDAISDAFD